MPGSSKLSGSAAAAGAARASVKTNENASDNDRVPITDVAVIVIELFVTNLQAHRAHALDQDPRSEIEPVLVAPSAVDVTQPQPLEFGRLVKAHLDWVVGEPARQHVVPNLPGYRIEGQVERERFGGSRRKRGCLTEQHDRMHLGLRALRLGLEGRHESGRAAGLLEHALRRRELTDIQPAKVRIAAMRGERTERARNGHAQKERSESAGRLADDGATAFACNRGIAALDGGDGIPNDVRGVVAVMDRVDVLRTAEARVAVHDGEQHGRHRAAADERIGPLYDVGFPGAARK
jgi:hypothetical protein